MIKWTEKETASKNRSREFFLMSDNELVLLGIDIFQAIKQDSRGNVTFDSEFTINVTVSLGYPEKYILKIPGLMIFSIEDVEKNIEKIKKSAMVLWLEKIKKYVFLIKEVELLI
jgi:hypothetical protein